LSSDVRRIPQSRAEQQFRRITGYRDLATLVIAVERHTLHAATASPDRHEIAEAVTV
jgi:hypothetical protein